MRYVATKFTKRLESRRVRHATQDRERVLLLPLSFGISSVALLHLLDSHLQSQRARNHRTGFALHVLHIISPDDDLPSPAPELLDRLQARYIHHRFSSVPLADILEQDALELLQSCGLPIPVDDGSSNEKRLQGIFSSLPSSTSRVDVLGILRTRLVVRFAKAHECESILWGDTTTRLAEKTLAETAKGRGYSLPWHTADGVTPFGLAFHYPLRDLMKKELLDYADLTTPALSSLNVVQAPSSQLLPSSKNSSIDYLMTQYFASVEESYPSIVANVVRTSGKLKVPETTAGEIICSLCGMPVASGLSGLHGWGGDQEQAATRRLQAESGAPAEALLCYGCSRATLGARR
ncbi:MAG: cytoplasmic tRNA 2-thiolation protein 2 [Thelocarpon superellum]|nr:MAG: cytoplasmic tRNA 2-thiolation protein 2 [Thelocarpon superellum]